MENCDYVVIGRRTRGARPEVFSREAGIQTIGKHWILASVCTRADSPGRTGR
jgi:hypothetical protein